MNIQGGVYRTVGSINNLTDSYYYCMNGVRLLVCCDPGWIVYLLQSLERAGDVHVSEQ